MESFGSAPLSRQHRKVLTPVLHSKAWPVLMQVQAEDVVLQVRFLDIISN